MSVTQEIERTFLLKSTPKNLDEFKKQYLMDVYLPPELQNPQIRLRQIDKKFFLTKKYPQNVNDLSIMIEETLNLSELEFDYFKSYLKGKKLEKTRYSKTYETFHIDLDVYLGDLSPLIILDVELTNPDENIDEILKHFNVEVEITNNKKFAGGLIAGKTYNEIFEN
jgi:adenylate cyclase